MCIRDRNPFRPHAEVDSFDVLDVILVPSVEGIEVVAVLQQDGGAPGPGAHVVRRAFHLGTRQVVLELGGDDEVDAPFLRLINATREFSRQDVYKRQGLECGQDAVQRAAAVKAEPARFQHSGIFIFFQICLLSTSSCV